MTKPNVLVISAINLFEGGPLSVLKDCLDYLKESEYTKEYKILALVHKKNLFDESKYSEIEFVEFPKSRNSYFYRLYYEYVYFKKFAHKNKVTFWLSLHDISPNIGNVPQAVYCHNPSPFNTVNFRDLYLQPTQLLFRFFYKYLYKINIGKNKYVVVQQQWLKCRFEKMFNINSSNIIVARPEEPNVPEVFLGKNISENGIVFFYPAYPRPFKNLEVIGKAIEQLKEWGVENFKVIITLNGKENRYSESIYSKFNHLQNLVFAGLLKREEVYNIYGACDCLLFPSKLETWGLPISEFKQFKKPMFVADMEYAKETAAGYNQVSFFDPTNPKLLASLMRKFIDGEHIDYSCLNEIKYDGLYSETWKGMFDILLDKK
jgi:glycosyltransferase involved in cell wall biosynthesis